MTVHQQGRTQRFGIGACTALRIHESRLDAALDKRSVVEGLAHASILVAECGSR